MALALALAFVSVRPDFLLFPRLYDEVHVRLHRTIKEVAAILVLVNGHVTDSEVGPESDRMLV